MKKVKLIIGSLFIAGVMLLNVSLLTNKTDFMSNLNLLSLQALAGSGDGETHYGECADDYDVTMPEWDLCYICIPVTYDSCCGVSQQCCFDQEPYC